MRWFPLMLAGCTSASTVVEERPCGHAHNDQENARPLVGALEAGFCSVEVDVHLVDGEVLVGHDLEQTVAGVTLEGVYLGPLESWLRAHAVPSRSFLLIDVKSDAATTWTAIEARLQQFDLEGVQIVISGNVDRDAVRASPHAEIDGRIADLEAGVSPDHFPMISDKWTAHFTWVGGVETRMPVEERMRLEALAARAQDTGHQLRFWQTGERREVWAAQAEAGVDLINTDDVPGLAAFLAARLP